MEVTLLVWIVTIAVTIAFFVFEFFAHVRTPHEPSLGEAARWSAFSIGLALLFPGSTSDPRETRTSRPSAATTTAIAAPRQGRAEADRRAARAS